VNAVEFTAELSSGEWLHIPAEAVARLPKEGKFKVIVLPCFDEEDAQWRLASYQQFLSDDAPEDTVYDTLL